MIEIIWSWHPSKALGPFEFNKDITEYIDTYNLEKDLKDVNVNEWISY